MSRIVIINNGLAGGGIERASTSMANQFARWGHDVHLVALYQSEHFIPLESSVTFVEPTVKNRNRMYVLYLMYYVRRKVRYIRPDTVLAYNEWTNPYILLALQGLRIPVFVTDRMSPLIKCPKITEFLKRHYYRKAAGVIAQTEFAKKIIFERTGAENIIVIPNPVNAVNAVSCKKRNLFITVGRLSKEKGHEFLIEAFAKVRDTSWSLNIIGDGNERQTLEELASELGVRDRVFFYGHLYHFEKQLSEAKIFVLPSLSEGFPNAVIEAMSVPLPCIVTRCTPAMDEVVSDGINGILVEKGDSDRLAEAMMKLASDESLQKTIAQNACSVRSSLDFGKIANQYLKFILI